MFIFTHSSSFVLPRYCRENVYRSFHTLQECAGYIVVYSTLWTRFPAQKHQLIWNWALCFCFTFISPAPMDAKLSLELYFAPKISGNLMLSLKVPKYKCIFSCHLLTLWANYLWFHLWKLYTAAERKKNESIYLMKKTEYGKG